MKHTIPNRLALDIAIVTVDALVGHRGFWRFTIVTAPDDPDVLVLLGVPRRPEDWFTPFGTRFYRSPEVRLKVRRFGARSHRIMQFVYAALRRWVRLAAR